MKCDPSGQKEKDDVLFTAKDKNRRCKYKSVVAKCAWGRLHTQCRLWVPELILHLVKSMTLLHSSNIKAIILLLFAHSQGASHCTE